MDKDQADITAGEKNNSSPDSIAEPLGKTILDLIAVLTKWRRFIVWLVMISTIMTIIVTLLLPKWYKATASVFPTEQANLFGGLEGVSSLVKTLSGGNRKLPGLAGSSETDRYVAILKSDRVIGEMMKRFNLTEVYDLTTSSFANEKTAKELVGNTVIEIQDEGNLTVSVYDKDPKRAADMANSYIELLNSTNSELMAQDARGTREFIEQRYQKNLVDLRAAEEAMKNFQIKHGVVAVPEQTEASIKESAGLYGMLAAKEIELGVLKRTLSESHPSISSAEIEVEETKKKLRDMNSGSLNAGDDLKILVPFRQAPELAQQYVRLYRDLQIQNKVLEFITPLYEQAKVEEKRSTPSVVVLDHASVPERKAKPKVSLFALLSFVISVMISLFIVFTAEGIERLRSINPERFGFLVGTLRADWFGLKSSPFKRFRRNSR